MFASLLLRKWTFDLIQYIKFPPRFRGKWKDRAQCFCVFQDKYSSKFLGQNKNALIL